MKSISHAFVISLAVSAVHSIAIPPADSPFGPAAPAVSGQIRTRTEYDRKILRDSGGQAPFLNTQLRSRLGFSAAPSEKVGIRFEFQDTRFMGSEPSSQAANPAGASVGNGKGVDLLQGFATLTEGAFAAALGRQKLSLGSGRFLSTLEWSPTSRAFDGVSFNYGQGEDNLTGLVFLVRDSADKAVEDRLVLSGLFYGRKPAASHQAEAFVFYDQSRLASAYGGLSARNYDLVYLGERLSGRFGPFTYEEEFIWQGGELSAGRDLTSAAFQSAVRVGAALKSHKVNAGLDIMSGDDDPFDGQATAYRANYYFAHAYYGWMDYFAVNPPYGVMDFRLDGDLGFLAGPSGAPRVSIKTQYHFFLPQNPPSGSDDPYGQELDLEIHLAVYPKTSFVLGAGLFLPDDGAVLLPSAALGRNKDYQPGYFLYFMPTFNF